MIKLISSYGQTAVNLLKKKVLDGILFSSIHGRSIYAKIRKLRQEYSGCLIYLDNGAFTIFKGGYNRVNASNVRINIVEHIEKYLELVKICQPDLAPVPLDLIVSEKLDITVEEFERAYKRTMEMNKLYSGYGLAPVIHFYKGVDIRRYVSDLKDCKFQYLCIGGVAASGVSKTDLGVFIRYLQDEFPHCKIHVFGRPVSWLPFLEWLKVYSVDTNTLSLVHFIKRHKESKKFLTLKLAKIQDFVVKDVMDKIRWLKYGSSGAETTVINTNN